MSDVSSKVVATTAAEAQEGIEFVINPMTSTTYAPNGYGTEDAAGVAGGNENSYNGDDDDLNFAGNIEVESGTDDPLWFSRGMDEQMSMNAQMTDEDRLRKIKTRQPSVNRGSFGFDRLSTKGAKSEDPNVQVTTGDLDADSPNVIYESATICFNYVVFIKQLWVHVFPYLAIILTPCIVNWTNHGFNIKHELTHPLGQGKAIIVNWVVPLLCLLMWGSASFSISGLCVGGDEIDVCQNAEFSLVSECCYDGGKGKLFQDYSNSSPSSGYIPFSRILLIDTIIPFIMLLLHRISVATKHASLSPSEYIRFQTCSYEVAKKYNKQMELLSSWDIFRDMDIVYFNLQVSATRVGLQLKELFFTIDNPNASGENLYNFMQWQALLLNRPSIKGLNNEVDEELVKIMKVDKNGNYRVGVEYVSMAILLWIEGIGEILGKKTKLLKTKASAACVMSKENIDLSKTERVKEFTETAVFEYFQLFIIACITVLPSLYIPLYHVECREANSLFLSVLIPCQFILCLIGIVTFKFNVCMLHDSTRRSHEAHLLAEMIRIQDNVHDVKFMDLAKNDAGRTLYFMSSNMDQYGKNAANTIDWLPKLQASATIDKGNGITTSSSCMNESEGDDIIFASRMPRISSIMAPQSNVLCWNYMRCMFRRTGMRFRYRMDCICISIFIVFFFLFFYIFTVILYGTRIWVTELIASPFAVQVLLGVLLMVTSIALNISSAAKTNAEYEFHSQVLGRKIMKEEAAFCELSDSEIIHSAKTIDKLKALKSMKCCLELTATCVKLTDEQVPLTILGVPCTSSLYSTFVSLCLTLVVSMMSLYTSNVQDDVNIVPTAQPTFAPT